MERGSGLLMKADMDATEYAKAVREGWKEEVFVAHVVQLAQMNGWMVAHFRPARTAQGWRTAMTGDKGFPDIVAARDGVHVFAELKTDKGRLSHEQANWLDNLKGNGQHVYLWRPGDWEQIVDVFR